MIESKNCKSCGRDFRSEADFLNGTYRWRQCSAGNLWFNCSCGSTLIIPKGKYAWYSPEKALGSEATTVFNSLAALKDLPHIPSQILEIQQLINNPDSKLKDIAIAIKKDPIGATQLLTIADNIRFSRDPGNAPIKTLEHAVVYLGLKTVGEMVLASALHQFKFPKSGFDFRQFWHEAHLCGAIAEYLNTAFVLNLNQDEVYLAASMCNLGKLVTAFSFPEIATEIQNDISSHSKPQNWRQAEAKSNFPDHRILGEISASFWGFPTDIIEASRRHHDPLTTSKKFSLHELIAVSNQLVHWVLLMPSRIEEPVLNSFYLKTGMQESELEALIKSLSKLNDNLTNLITAH